MKKKISSILLFVTIFLICIQTGFSQEIKNNTFSRNNIPLTMISFNANTLSYLFDKTSVVMADEHILVQQSHENAQKILHQTRIKRTLLTSGILLFSAGAITSLSGVLFFAADSLSDSNTDTYLKQDGYLIAGAGMMLAGTGLSGMSQLFWRDDTNSTSQSNDALDKELREYRQDEDVKTKFTINR